jgi:hypothetical protein
MDDLLKTEKIKSWKETRKEHSKHEIAAPEGKGESNAAISLHGIFIFSRVTNVWSAAPYQRHKAPKKFQNLDFPLPGEKGTQ